MRTLLPIQSLYSSLLILLLATPCAIANPFTFEMTEHYSYNSNPALFGSSVVIDVTFDNGKTDDFSQSYKFSQITKVAISTIGGTYNQQYNTTGIAPQVTNGEDVFLTTNANGLTGLFQFSITNNSHSLGGFQRIGAPSRVNTSSLIAEGSTSAYIQLQQESIFVWQHRVISDQIERAYLDSHWLPTYVAATLQTPTNTPVPIPPSFIMFATSLMVISCSRRKKSQTKTHQNLHYTMIGSD